MDGTRLEGLGLHPNGELIMLNYSTTNPPDGDKSNWAEIRRVSDQKKRCIAAAIVSKNS